MPAPEVEREPCHGKIVIAVGYNENYSIDDSY